MAKRTILYFKEARVSLELNPKEALLTFIWQGQALPSDYQRALRRGLLLLQENTIRYWVSDFRQMEINTNIQSQSNWTESHWVNEAFALGLEKFLVVVSPSIFNEKSRQQIAKRKVSSEDKVAFFCDEKGVKRYLQSLMPSS